MNIHDTPTIEELDKAREEQGITRQTLSVTSGASSSAFGNAVRQGLMSEVFRRNAVRVLRFHKQNGYVPAGEVRIEDLPPGPKS
jgi:hypothetical protein